MKTEKNIWLVRDEKLKEWKETKEIYLSDMTEITPELEGGIESRVVKKVFTNSFFENNENEYRESNMIRMTIKQVFKELKKISV